MGLLSTIGAASGRAFGLTRVGAAIRDAYFNLTTLLLPGNGTNGAQNNTFLDSSSNNFTITRNGNTTQGTFSPFSQTGWSNFFDGSDDFLQRTSPSSALVDWTSTNWTLEYWIHANAFGQGANTGSNVFGNANDGGSNEYWSFGPISTGAVRWYYYTGASPSITTTTTLVTNRWYHLAFVNNGGNLAIYIDGVSSATGTIVGTPQFGSAVAMTLGKCTGSSFNGYLSNLRITQSAVYTSNFTPSTTPLTAISGTQLLMCQSNRFRDISTNAFVFTPSGTPSVQAFSPFAPTAAYSAATVGGSGYFDGTGDYLASATSTDLQLGSSDFSLEWWEYRTVLSNVDTAIVCGDGTFNAQLAYYNTGFPRFYLSTTGSSWNVFSDAATGAIAANSWNHFVLTRSGTAFRVFLNGVLSIYATGSGSVTQSTNQIFISGGVNGNSAPIEGYMSGVRFVKGSIPTTYQTSSTTTNTSIFTPPTAPVTTTSQGATSGDVKYLVNFTNAGITDATAKNDLETVGNAQISTTQSKFGGSSMYFDGTGDWLLGTPSVNNDFGTGNFTIEAWIYMTSTSNYFYIYNSSNANFNSPNFTFLYDISLGLRMYAHAGTHTVNQGSTSGWSANTWYYVALVRNGGTITIYRDGVSLASGSTFSGVSFGSSTALTQIGGSSPDSRSNNGYIDELRVTKGYARTVTSVPTAAFPLQ